jgi:coenzyme PQQ precursor peptide PqqA
LIGKSDRTIEVRYQTVSFGRRRLTIVWPGPYLEPRQKRTEDRTMSWKTPKITEVALGGEINCYACARLT